MSVKIIARGALAVACVCLPAYANEQSASDDAVVRAMRDELTRSAEHLQLPDAGKPYYFALLLNDQSNVMVSASFGSVVTKLDTKLRLMRADVRVGDYSIDSSNMARRAGTSVQELPLDDDYDVVRHDAWYAFDDAYKQAAAAFARKMAMRESLAQDSDEVADFSRETPSQVVVTRPLDKLDLERSAALVKELSAVAKKFPALQSSEVRLVAVNARQVVVTSEGSFTSETDTATTLGVILRTQAPDGMPLSRFESYTVLGANTLPQKAAIVRDIERVSNELTALRDGEQAQDYTGPVLFEGLASAQLATYLLAPHFAGTPAPKNEAMRGPGSESQLAGKLGQRVLPAGFVVIDDPTIDRLGETPLIGHSAADDEGMPAQKVVLVQDGILQDFLMSRTPRKGFAHSNGHAHGSMSGAIRAGIGNLIVTSGKPVSRTELYKKLLTEAKASGQSYGIIVRQLDDPMATGDYSALMRRNASNVPPPTVLVKLTADGKEQPLRGGTFGMVPLAAFEDIVAAGQDLAISNRLVPYPSSVAAPALLFKRLEVRKPVDQSRKPPVLAHPFFATGE
jgi:TldD protein